MMEKMTIEELARMSQEEFMAIRGEMAGMRIELKGDIRLLRNDVDAGFQSVNENLKFIRNDIREYKGETDMAIESLGLRVERLEKRR